MRVGQDEGIHGEGDAQDGVLRFSEAEGVVGGSEEDGDEGGEEKEPELLLLMGVFRLHERDEDL
jgi:hypothetical protein